MTLHLIKYFALFLFILNASFSFSDDIYFIDELNKVEKNQNDWADSWSNSDLQKYLGFYSDTYAPKELSHNQWLKQRKARLNKSNNIQVSIKIESLVMDGEVQNATIIITQDYQSNTYKDKVKKQFIWHKNEGLWKITEEKLL